MPQLPSAAELAALVQALLVTVGAVSVAVGLLQLICSSRRRSAAARPPAGMKLSDLRRRRRAERQAQEAILALHRRRALVLMRWAYWCRMVDRMHARGERPHSRTLHHLRMREREAARITQEIVERASRLLSRARDR